MFIQINNTDITPNHIIPTTLPISTTLLLSKQPYRTLIYIHHPNLNILIKIFIKIANIDNRVLNHQQSIKSKSLENMRSRGLISEESLPKKLKELGY